MKNPDAKMKFQYENMKKKYEQVKMENGELKEKMRRNNNEFIEESFFSS